MIDRFASCAGSAIALVAMPLVLVAQTPDLPPRKAGLWEISTANEKPGEPRGPRTRQVCVDAATDRDLMDHALGGGAAVRCKSSTTKRAADSFVVETECTLGPAVIKTRAEVTGDFDTSYVVRKDIGGLVTEQTARWKGANCPGMSSGDISVGDVNKINVRVIKGFVSGRIVDKLPPRRPGQWEVTYMQEIPALPDHAPLDVRLAPSRMCIDPVTDGPTMEIGLGLIGGCAGGDIERRGGEWVQDDRCELGGHRQGMKLTISGDFQTTITVRSEHSLGGPLDKMRAMVVIRTAHWLGETCADGMVPGDIIMHGGKAKLNPVRQWDILGNLVKGALEKALPPSDKKLLPPKDSK